jgi:hypothetical protein
MGLMRRRVGRWKSAGLAFRSQMGRSLNPPPVITGLPDRSLPDSRLGIAWACRLAWSQCAVSVPRVARKGA